MKVELEIITGMSTDEAVERYGAEDPESPTSSVRCGHSNKITNAGCGSRNWLDSVHDQGKILIECHNCRRLLVSHAMKRKNFNK